MIIRKQYKFEAAHIVRDCASKRCSKTIHGHSYIVEFLLRSNVLDNGGMVIDFGLLKTSLGEFADSFDHALMVYENDVVAVSVANSSSERVVTSPYNMTAENIAKVFFMGAQGIVGSMAFNNQEGEISVDSVIVHETATGYAQAFEEDISTRDRELMHKLHFSPAIKADWTHPGLDVYVTDGMSGDYPLTLPEEV